LERRTPLKPEDPGSRSAADERPDEVEPEMPGP
jgi:hypothetical protein